MDGELWVLQASVWLFTMFDVSAVFIDRRINGTVSQNKTQTMDCLYLSPTTQGYTATHSLCI